MAVYVAITKVSESMDRHVYEISANGEIVNYVAVITPSKKIIEFYKDSSLKECVYTYKVFEEGEENPNKSMAYKEKDALLWGRSLTRLIPAVRKGIFPKYLDKCS